MDYLSRVFVLNYYFGKSLVKLANLVLMSIVHSLFVSSRSLSHPTSLEAMEISIPG